MGDKKNVLLIIGNGFDLNVGLKTGYNHYLETVSLPNNPLFLELQVRNKVNWVDIEKELEDCANNRIHKLKDFKLSTQDFEFTRKSDFIQHEDYVELKNSLKEYLSNQQIPNKINNFINRSSINLLYKLLDREEINLTVLNFNYTNTVKTIITIISNDFIPESVRIKSYSINYISVHGKLEKNIVFGIDDKSIVDREYVYLHKSFDNNTTTVNISKLLEDHEEVIFYGYSLGITDSSYFDDYFKKICLHNNKPKEEQRTITFYHYKEEGYIDLFNRLLELTNHSTAKLRQYNDVEFIDSSINQ